MIQIVKSVPACENLLTHPLAKLLKGHPETILHAAKLLKTEPLLKVYEDLNSQNW